MLENDVNVTLLVSQFIRETNHVLKPIKKEIDVCDLCIFDEEKNEMINYGNINDIINSDYFKKWYESKGDNNGKRMEIW